MSEWIIHRSPTEEEVGDDEFTMGSIDDRVFGISGKTLREAPSTTKYAWMPRPKPYQPPKPDTSLSASIEQIETAYPIWKTLPHLKDHIERILEAARKWDEIEKKDDCVVDPYLSSVCSRGTKSCYRTHDDIGESEAGRKYEERTGATSYNKLFGLGSHPKDPSMAVSPEENCGAEGQAETQPRERSSNPQDKPIEHGTSSGDKPKAPVISSGDKQQAPVVSSGDTAETQSDSKPDPIWCEWKEVSE